MKSYFSAVVTILAVLLLSSGGLLVTHAATPPVANDYGQNNLSSQALKMSITGGVVSAGNQRYFIHQEGTTLQAIVEGIPLVSSQLTYTLYANQQGLSTSGRANFQLTGTDASGTNYVVSGTIPISGSVVGACLPSFSSGTCAPGDTSEVPAAFTGAGSVQISTGTSSAPSGNDNGNGGDYGNGHSHNHSSTTGSTPTAVTEAMAFENAYFNPFGNEITIASADSSIIILTNYTVATIDWSKNVDIGGFVGSLGTTPIAGAFTQIAAEHENLVTGTARDVGVLTLYSVTNLTSGTQIDYMNATGAYVGTSTIPHTGAVPCGIGCTETGFQSQGSFLLFSGHDNGGAVIRGSYDTTWTVPAFAFQSTAYAKVTTASS